MLPFRTASTSARSHAVPLLEQDAHLSSDLAQFLAGYPSQRTLSTSKTPNFDFYKSESGVVAMQNSLRGDWDELEWKHDFIQWLFPIREQGMNPRAYPLQPHEIPLMVSSETVLERLLASYEIMLAFYGFRLVDSDSGEIDVVEQENGPGGWKARFRNLQESSHNYLRITRILKCLQELGRPQFVPPFLLFILALQYPSEHDPSVKPRLKTSGLMRSMDGYWRHCIRDDATRERVRELFYNVRTGQKAWGIAEYKEGIASFRHQAGGEGSDSADNDGEPSADRAKEDVDGSNKG